MHKRNGFTLIELLLVITIIASLLATWHIVVVPAWLAKYTRPDPISAITVLGTRGAG